MNLLNVQSPTHLAPALTLPPAALRVIARDMTEGVLDALRIWAV